VRPHSTCSHHYKQQEKELIRLKREAKAAKGFYVEPEAKLAFVIRIRGLNKIHPKVRGVGGGVTGGQWGSVAAAMAPAAAACARACVFREPAVWMLVRSAGACVRCCWCLSQ